MTMRNIPNILTVFRLLLVPVFLAAYWRLPDHLQWISAVVLLVSGVTDIADGYIARKYNFITQLGQFLDPLADKLMIAAAIISVSITHPVVRLLAGLFVIKELTLALIGLKKLKSWRNSPAAKWYGKLTTVLFYLLILAAICLPGISETALFIMSLFPTVFMILSFIFYLKEIKKQKTDL